MLLYIFFVVSFGIKLNWMMSFVYLYNSTKYLKVYIDEYEVGINKG
jgi:hypothetical protein